MLNSPPTYDVPVMTKGANTSAWYRWFQGLAGGFTGTITTAKLTSGGTEGSMTFTNGIVTSQTAAT
jgi:hypothetical protein